MKCPGIVISALHGGAGKTILTLGIVSALKSLGKRIAPFKKGPDYIDAGWLALAAGRPCYNLDTFLLEPETVLTSFFSNTHLPEDIAVIEGNRGLYDAIDTDGSTCTAELAKFLNLPVILCVDCTKTTRTVAALEHITPNLIRAWGQELAAYDYVRNLPGLLLYRLSTTHRPPKPEHRGGPRCKEEPGTQLALPAEAVNPPPPPSLPDDVHQDLDTLGWVGPRDEVVTAFQQEPDSVRAWLDYWLRHAHDVNNPAGAFRQALRSGCHPPRPLDPADKQRRYISGPYAHLIQH